MDTGKSLSLINKIVESSWLNACIQSGTPVEIHPFPFKNALLVVYRYLEPQPHECNKGDMRWDLIQEKDGKITHFGSRIIYLELMGSTPESVSKSVAKDYNLLSK